MPFLWNGVCGNLNVIVCDVNCFSCWYIFSVSCSCLLVRNRFLLSSWFRYLSIMLKAVGVLLASFVRLGCMCTILSVGSQKGLCSSRGLGRLNMVCRFC